MRSEETVLLARRTTDGLFLVLHRYPHTTDCDFVKEPEMAERIDPCFPEDLVNPQPAAFYFENSSRARNIWTKDCVMVPYKIVTEIVATPLTKE